MSGTARWTTTGRATDSQSMTTTMMMMMLTDALLVFHGPLFAHLSAVRDLLVAMTLEFDDLAAQSLYGKAIRLRHGDDRNQTDALV